MTIADTRPTPAIPAEVISEAAAAARVDSTVLARAVDMALAGGPDQVEPGWKRWAACHGQVDAFFPDRAAGAAVRERLDVCRSCPVQDACLSAALEGGEHQGLWGGTSGAGRTRLRNVLRHAGVLGVVGEDAYIAWREDGADREPAEPPALARRFTPWPHQIEAVRDITAALADGGRCQIAIATAGGKTHIALWAATALDVDQVLVLVPNLALVAQTAEAWAADDRWGSAATLAVCSDTGDLPLEATTDPARVTGFLADAAAAGQRTVVYGTYQSSQVLSAAGCTFDLAVADEAHHLAGEKDKPFAAILRGEIGAERILFMTATPRRFARRKGDVELVSMDDTHEDGGFGPRVHELTLAEAVDAGVVADYRVVIAAVEREAFDRVAAHPDLVDVDPHLLAGAIAVVRAMGDYDLASCLSFHTRVDRAHAFARLIGPVAEALTALRPAGPGWCGYLHGGTSVRIRRRLVARLADDRSWGVLANARALGEGVDLPTLDAVAIVDPKNAEADVLQATGRALRKPSGTRKVGTVLLPVLLTGETDPADPLAGLDPRSLEIVSGVLRALRSHDAELGSRLDSARRDLAKATVNAGHTANLTARMLQRRAARAFLRSRVEMWLPGGATGELAGAMAVHLVRETSSSWEAALGRLEAWIAEHGTARVPQEHGKVPDETGTFSLGAWCTVQRSLRRRGLLAADREARLAVLPGWRWDPREEAWWEQFDALADYLRAHGGAYPAQSAGSARYQQLWRGKRVAQFVNETRNGYRDGWLRKFDDRIEALEALPGWVWNKRDAEWEENFARLERWVRMFGHAQPVGGDLVDGVDVGRWVSKQRARVNGSSYRDGRTGRIREESISEARKAKLRALPGWVDHTREAGWDNGFGRLVEYLDANGGDYPTQKYVTADGYRLGVWVAKQRQRRDGTKRPDRRERLEALPGWSWTPWLDAWNNACEILERHAAAAPPERGVLRIPVSRVEDFDLNAWCTNQRRDYHAGGLEPERVARLEAVPGWSWNVADAKFERGIQALASWLAREGNCEPPSAHREGGVALRAWIYGRRAQHRVGDLEADRVAQLEAIAGWCWEPSVTIAQGWHAQWERMYGHLVEWLADQPIDELRQDVVLPGDVRLGAWTAKQRSKYQAGQLADERLRRLEALDGWTWDLRQRREAS